MIDNDAASIALIRARTALVLDKPFLGALTLRLPMIAADPDWCRTTATDARSFYYNPNYISGLTAPQVQFVLAHEALHCALTHFARRLQRSQLRWDIACDQAINPLLMRDGLHPPPGWLVIESFLGMTAEEIYPYIEDNPNDSPMDQHIYNGESSGAGSTPDPKLDSSGKSQPPPLSYSERDSLALQWRQRLAGAAQLARQAGKLSGEISRLVEDLLQPSLPWRVLLAHYLSATARDDYSFQRPSRREGNYILPSLRSGQLDLTIALDVSGSITPPELQEFLSEIDAIKGQIRARITLHACDERLAINGPWIFEPWENISLPTSLNGGGGTSFIPIFDWVAQCDRLPDLLVYFTDALGTFPRREPSYPVLWLVKGRSPIPWGTRVQL